MEKQSFSWVNQLLEGATIAIAMLTPKGNRAWQLNMSHWTFQVCPLKWDAFRLRISQAAVIDYIIYIYMILRISNYMVFHWTPVITITFHYSHVVDHIEPSIISHCQAVSTIINHSYRTITICSMYGIVTYVLVEWWVNIGKYSIYLEHVGMVRVNDKCEVWFQLSSDLTKKWLSS